MRSLRVATIPDRHPYIAAVMPTSARHLAFTVADAAQWAPSPLLRHDVLISALPDIDVVHVHFGYESLSETAMTAWIAAVRTSNAALVVTVHDLRNPHQRDDAAHQAHLNALLVAADEVLTLSAGAAREINERWHRAATVVAHPSLVRPDTATSSSASTVASGPPVVGIHLKSLRANVVEPHRIVRAAVVGIRGTSAIVQVNVHREAVSNPDLAEVLISAERGEIVLHVHERYDDHALARYLSGLQVSVLPYRFGTHSGWLELCRDLGTAVIAPDCGYYAEQWSDTGIYAHNESSGLSEHSLADAVRRAVRQPRPAPPDPAQRRIQRDDIRAQHDAVYRHVTRSAART